MPPRVVTIDIESLLGVVAYEVNSVPYNEGAVIPAYIQGGMFLNMIVYMPPGVADPSSLDANSYGNLSDAPQRVKRQDGGPVNEIWGWKHREVALDPNNEDDAVVIEAGRFEPIIYDLGNRLRWRLDAARPNKIAGGRIVMEALVNSPGQSANRPAEHVYDTLDAHPPGLRAVIERSPWARRETEADPAPGWNERKPDTP
jgi:hypothetical protein